METIEHTLPAPVLCLPAVGSGLETRPNLLQVTFHELIVALRTHSVTGLPRCRGREHRRYL